MMNNLSNLRCDECGPIPEDNVTRCIRCMAADEIKRLNTEGARKDAVIDRAIIAVRSLPEDALGYGRCGTVECWPFRDELLAELESAASSSPTD